MNEEEEEGGGGEEGKEGEARTRMGRWRQMRREEKEIEGTRRKEAGDLMNGKKKKTLEEGVGRGGGGG